ncbi:MAG: ATP-grasp domain-containing protein [Bryobacteraceae bacterium]
MRTVTKHLLLFAATTGYQIRVFAEAARRLGMDLTLATDRCHVLDDPWGDRAIAVKFDRIPESLDTLRGMNLRFDGVAAVGDQPAVLAAEAAQMFGLPFHPPQAAHAGRDKYLARSLYRAAHLKVPRFHRASFEEDPAALAARVPYPCVLKPLGLSASVGVIRANNPTEFANAFARIRRLGEPYLQVETYIEGREFAVEGLVTAGRFEALAIFDKPDPLEGPYFEESIYVTPSREPASVQQRLLETTRLAVRALGLSHGPVHAEMRYNRGGAWILETHARPIGGLCAKALRFEGGAPLEEIILRHAVGEDVSAARLEGPASGAMMIPLPKAGVYQSVEGVEEAAAVPGIEEVIVTAKPGQEFLALPERSSYLGFVFARGESPAQVEAALRQSHARLRFHIATALRAFPATP